MAGLHQIRILLGAEAVRELRDEEYFMGMLEVMGDNNPAQAQMVVKEEVVVVQEELVRPLQLHSLLQDQVDQERTFLTFSEQDLELMDMLVEEVVVVDIEMDQHLVVLVEVGTEGLV